jgi:hypothetical protein
MGMGPHHSESGETQMARVFGLGRDKKGHILIICVWPQKLVTPKIAGFEMVWDFQDLSTIFNHIYPNMTSLLHVRPPNFVSQAMAVFASPGTVVHESPGAGKIQLHHLRRCWWGTSLENMTSLGIIIPWDWWKIVKIFLKNRAEISSQWWVELRMSSRISILNQIYECQAALTWLPTWAGS